MLNLMHRGRTVAVQDHPAYPMWSEALDRMVEAERRYFEAFALQQHDELKRKAMRDMHVAREQYWDITDTLDSHRT
jgi:hypothetical protein